MTAKGTTWGCCNQVGFPSSLWFPGSDKTSVDKQEWSCHAGTRKFDAQRETLERSKLLHTFPLPVLGGSIAQVLNKVCARVYVRTCVCVCVQAGGFTVLARYIPSSFMTTSVYSASKAAASSPRKPEALAPALFFLLLLLLLLLFFFLCDVSLCFHWDHANLKKAIFSGHCVFHFTFNSPLKPPLLYFPISSRSFN